MYDYLAIGHVTEDVWRDGSRTPGGTVMYSSLTAKAFLPRVAVLTAASASFDVSAYPGIDVHRVESPTTTEFENIYANGHRTQVTRPSPVVLNASHLTPDLAKSRIAHLAPVCNEISVDLLKKLPASAFVGLTPQGWMRRWDAQGRVTQHPDQWADADVFLKRANAVVTSIEDVAGDWDVLHRWAQKTRLLVVTVGPRGCIAFADGKSITVPAPQVVEVDPTGAGDVFAATFFITLEKHADVARACAIANCVAAHSVTLPQLQGLPTPADVRRCEN